MILLFISYQNYKPILLAKCKLQREKYADKLFYQANIFEKVKSTKVYTRTFLLVLHHAEQTPPSLCVPEQEQSTGLAAQCCSAPVPLSHCNAHWLQSTSRGADALAHVFGSTQGPNCLSLLWFPNIILLNLTMS